MYFVEIISGSARSAKAVAKSFDGLAVAGTDFKLGVCGVLMARMAPKHFKAFIESDACFGVSLGFQCGTLACAEGVVEKNDSDDRKSFLEVE